MKKPYRLLSAEGRKIVEEVKFEEKRKARPPKVITENMMAAVQFQIETNNQLLIEI